MADSNKPADLAEENTWLKAALVCMLDQKCGDHSDWNPVVFDREVDRIESGQTTVEIMWDGGYDPPAMLRIGSILEDKA